MPLRSTKARIILLGCEIKKVRHVRTEHAACWSFRKCSIGIFEDVSSPNTSEPSETLSLQECKIEYLHTDATRVDLYRIPELNLVCSTDPSRVTFHLNDVHIKYRKSVLLKYAFWRNPAFDFSGYQERVWNKKRPLDKLRAYYCMYFRAPTGKDPITDYHATQHIYDYAKQAKVSSCKTVQPGDPRHNKMLEDRLRQGDNQFVLTNRSVRRNFLNTLRLLDKDVGLHSENAALMRYYYYFRTRETVLGRALFWIHEGYHNLLRPFLILFLSLTATLLLLSVETQQMHPIFYVLNPIKLIEDVLFTKLSPPALEATVSVLRRVGILLSQITGLYTLWSLLVALNRRFGFPRSLTDSP